MKYLVRSCGIAVLLFALVSIASSQTNASISGTVTFEGNARPLGGTIVRLSPSGLSTTTDASGNYNFSGVPPGRYSVIAHYAGFEDVARSIFLVNGAKGVVDLSMRLSTVREQVTVTATGEKQAAFDTVQPTVVVGSSTILNRGSVSIGDALNNQSGVAERTASPGSTRPVIRGFDGDRVLIAVDGVRDGSIAALAENEPEPIDLQSLDRIEVVRGPATLLYGSNAFGGVVNAITRHNDGFQSGLRGYATVLGGTNNRQAAVSGGAEYGWKNWMVWGSGSFLRAGDYTAGGNFGTLANTAARNANGNGGGGYFGKHAFFTVNYNYYRNRYGIPIDPADPDTRTETIAARRHNVRISAGWRDLDSFFESIKFTFDYSNYHHRESQVFDNDPTTMVFTDFDNKIYSYRATLTQRKRGALSGTFGFDGYHRWFFTHGDETIIAGTVTQTQSSSFALEQLDLKRVTFQFGGRVENSRYRPSDLSLVNRNLTGISGAFGMRVALWENGAFTANYSHSTRLPDLEEFYNDGPHDDTVSFEIGDPFLKKETSDAIDVSVRHQAKRFRADANFFHYWIKNFVFLEPTGVIDAGTGLEFANYVQADARFTGGEANLDFDATRYLGVFGGVDYVRASFTSGVDLPRIPPLRGRFGVDAHFHGAMIRPEVIVARAQDRVFTDETPTAGYIVFNVTGSYTFYIRRMAHTFGVNAFNLTNKLYFNHVSFIKDYTPEIGRGVRFSYTVRFL